ncbi:type II secretion system secretin GspD [Methyloglobulus sp.]|uniref:type II secretion system secretin GspD n=1 Tax=Methyloglobulus sp. TaxID=2518622 RepID=UPI003988E584
MNNFSNLIKAGYLIALGLMLTSCELLGPKRTTKIPLTPVAKEQSDRLDDSVVFQELQNKTPVNGALQSKVEMYPARDRFAPKTETHRQTKTGGPGTYSLNFDDADLGEVAKVILSDILGQNYVLSPKVVGKVTLNTTEPLSKAELLPTLEMVLRMNNAALVKDGKIYHIEPTSEALYSSSIVGSSTGFQSRVIPIRNVAAQEIADILKPLVHDKTILNVDSTRNTLVVQGTADELARVMDMVSTFDIDVLRGRSFALFPLNHVEPDKIIDELETVFNTSSGKEDSEFFRFLAIERMNAVLAITHQASYLRDIENWIYRLDRANTEAGGGVNVYKVQHMDAEELASTLNEIFTGGQPRDKSAKVAAGKKSGEVTNKDSFDSNNSQKTDKTSVKRKKSKAEGSRAGGGSADNDTKIVADIANNSLIIIATPQEYGKILPVIKQLDIMPLQVLIDATIAEVTLKDDLQYGIQWYLSTNRLGLGSSPSSVAGKLGDAAAVAALAGATGGLSAIYSSGSVKAVLNAQSQLNNVKIISSPSLMVLNNQEAKINVGDQVPLQTSSTSVPIAGGTDGASIAQSNQIQYKDTGVTLEVTPRVNSNGMVIMDISQIVSNVVPQPLDTETSVGVTTTATIRNREIESTVAVRDGETFALGGLITSNDEFIKSGIPFLHELPYIGPLFGSTTRNENRTELVVLITPRVVKTKQDARVVTDEFKRKLTGIYYDPTKPRKKGDWWRARDW